MTAAPRRRPTGMRQLKGRFFVRLLAAVLVVAVPLMAAMVAILTAIAGNGLVESTSVGVENLARDLSSRAQAWVDERHREIDQLATEIDSTVGLDLDAAARLLTTTTIGDPFAALEIVDERGHVLRSNSPFAQIDLSGQSWLSQAAAGDYVSDVMKDASGTHLDWFVTTPVVTFADSVNGILVGVVNLVSQSGSGGPANQLSRLLSTVNASSSADNTIEAIDGHHILVYSSLMGSGNDSRMIQAGALSQRVVNPAVTAALHGGSGSTRFVDGATDTIAGYAGVPALGWAIIVSENADRALAGVDALRNTGIVVLIAGGLLLTGLVFLLARREVRPISALSEAARVVAAGDLSVRVEPAGATEVSALGASFNAMVEGLATVVGLRRHISELEQVSRIDVLTGLHNRRHLDECLQNAVAAARRGSAMTGVLIVDVDHFKRINDHWGHAAGDTVLREVGKRLQSAMRVGDALGRWGGEEFLAVLEGATAQSIGVIAERMRRAVEERQFTLEKNLRVAVTVSIGYVWADDEPESLICRADEALYAAKAAGRNRTIDAATVDKVAMRHMGADAVRH